MADRYNKKLYDLIVHPELTEGKEWWHFDKVNGLTRRKNPKELINMLADYDEETTTVNLDVPNCIMTECKDKTNG